MKIKEYIKLLQGYDQELEPVIQVGNVFYPIIETDKIAVGRRENAYALAEEFDNPEEGELKHVVVAIAGGLED